MLEFQKFETDAVTQQVQQDERHRFRSRPLIVPFHGPKFLIPCSIAATSNTTTVVIATAMSSNTAKSVFQSLRRYLKAPWKITGPCASPEYLSSLPKATEYRVFCPATVPQKAIVPTANPDTVFDIKYFTRDQRRNRPPIRKKVLKKADVEAMMKEKKFEPSDFPRPYLTATIVEDENARGGGYQK